MILEAERAEPFVERDAWVIDLGACVGEFTEWAASRGARVLAIEPVQANVEALSEVADRYPDQVIVVRCAAGPSGSARVIESEHRTGAVAVPDPDGTLTMFSLDAITTGLDVAVLKCDIQGGEYALFGEASDDVLRRCRLITIERHAWTTPDEEPIEGWGVVDGPRLPAGAYNSLVRRMERTHRVEVDADLLYCYRDAA